MEREREIGEIVIKDEDKTRKHRVTVRDRESSLRGTDWALGERIGWGQERTGLEAGVEMGRIMYVGGCMTDMWDRK